MNALSRMDIKIRNSLGVVLGVVSGFVVATTIGSGVFALFKGVEGCGPAMLVCGGIYFGFAGSAVGGMLGYAFLTKGR